jgi:hypothetical protein
MLHGQPSVSLGWFRNRNSPDLTQRDVRVDEIRVVLDISETDFRGGAVGVGSTLGVGGRLSFAIGPTKHGEVRAE